NRGRRQRRSRVTKNEAEYNLDLAAYMIERVFHTPVTDAIEPITLPRQSHAEVSAHRVLRELDLTADHFLIVHPGMGGSARNLSPAAYAAWIPELERLYGIPA